jgi:DNA-binding transcriptional LysR family regulator
VEFLVTAQHIIAEVDAAVSNLRTKSRGKNGWLTIGIYASPSAGNLYATLLEQRRRFPDVQIQTIDGDHERLLFGLTSQVIDVAIMTKCRQAWDGRVLPLWSERVILAVPEHHHFGGSESVRWSELVDERLLLTQQGPVLELERLLATKLGNVAAQHLLRHNVGLDRLLSLVSADYGGLLMLEGATGVRYNGVVYREVCDDDGPTRLNFSAYWRHANTNPALAAFLAMLRERYPDLSDTSVSPA